MPRLGALRLHELGVCLDGGDVGLRVTRQRVRAEGLANLSFSPSRIPWRLGGDVVSELQFRADGQGDGLEAVHQNDG